MQIKDANIAVVGLGYVGLPLAAEFGKIRNVVGFDINPKRINELRKGIDKTGELSSRDFQGSPFLEFTDQLVKIAACNCFIISVPTPINDAKIPDLSPLLKASNLVGKVLKKGDIVIYESTVYPGCTEDNCVPMLERSSQLKYNIDFFCGYSPERINPSDRERRITDICKVTSGSTDEVADFVDALYAEIIPAGTHKAETIRIAEAAKVIENTQRDVNIALINELSIIFNRMNIDTEAVLRAAATKWNFLPFKPGLVGGHCIGVDPYYLTHKAQEIGYHPQLVTAGRRVNDAMGSYVATQTIKGMAKKGISIVKAKILILGLSFKENCKDLRNTRVIDIIDELRNYNCQIDVFDPLVCPEEAKKEYGLELIKSPKKGAYDAVIFAVAHDSFISKGSSKINAFGQKNCFIYDLKSALEPSCSDMRL